MYWIRKIEALTNAAAAVGAFLLLPLVGSMVYEVLSRYLFSAPTFWAYELAYMMMGSIFMLGMAYALKEKAHVSVDLFYLSMGVRAKAVVNLLGFLLFIPCLLWLTYALFGYMVKAYEGHELSGQSAWNPVIWPYRSLFVAGFVILTLQSFVEVWKSICALRRGEEFGPTYD